MTIKKVTALIVTYNRADMLEKTINLIENQDIKVNNYSSLRIAFASFMKLRSKGQ